MKNAEVRLKSSGCTFAGGLMHRHAALCALHCALVACMLLLSSCDQGGAILGLVARQVPHHIDAAYKGMSNQTVLVMVWMDRSMRADHPDLQADIATGLQNKLINIAKDKKPDLLKGTEFPEPAQEVIRYQEDHPEINLEPVTDTAARLNGSRLIYLEIKDFGTHSGAPELFRGSLTGDVKVVEMTKTGVDKNGNDIISSKIAYHEEDIGVTYPKDSPKDGLPIGTETKITQGTVDLFTDEVAKRFYPHDEDRD